MSTPVNDELYSWFRLLCDRQGLPQALECLCAVLGVAPVLSQYLERWLADEQAQVAQEWRIIEEEWARIFVMEDALKRRGVDHLVWNCPALATRACRMWE